MNKEISDMENKEIEKLKDEAEILRKAFSEQKVSLVDFEKMFKPKMSMRHNQQLIKSVFTQLSKVPFSNTEPSEATLASAPP